jgi:hypothetical protein
MLSDNNAVATVGVKNLETSKEFYERTLELTKVMENDEVLPSRAACRRCSCTARRTPGRTRRRP